MQTLVLTTLDDLRVILAENELKNETWNSKQAADFLNISVTQLHKHTKTSEIPGVQIGADWKYSSIALYRYVARESA